MNKIKHYFNKQHLLLLLVVAFFYGNTLRNGYSIDDTIVTEKTNVTSQGIKSIPKIIKSHYIEWSKDINFEYRPIVKISFAIEHQLFGVHPSISHFFNILIYFMSLCILLTVLKLVFSGYDPQIIFYCVLLFAILPIHTEVVASLKNRDILLCFMFCVIGLKNAVLYFNSAFKNYRNLFVFLLCFYIALLCKLDALPYLSIVPVIIYARQKINVKILFYFSILFIVSWLLYILTKKGLLDKSITKRVYYYFENPLYFNHGFKYKAIALFNSLGFYVNQIIFPFKQCCYYGAGTISILELNNYGFFGILITPMLVLGLIVSFKKKDFMLFTGLFIFCASISMYLNFVRPSVGIVADRFTFFASLGASIAIIALLIKIKVKVEFKKTVQFIAFTAMVAFCVITVKRNTNWKNTYTIMAADLNKYPNNAFINYKVATNIIAKLQERKNIISDDQKKIKLLEAKRLIEKSIAVDPNYPNTRNYLAYILVYLLNDFSAAIPHINYSLKIKETAELYYYKAICMRETKQEDSTEFYLKKSIHLDPYFSPSYNLLAFDYNAKKEYQKSINLYSIALKKGVNTVAMNNGLAKTYFEMGNNTEAKRHYKQALTLAPENEEAATMLKRIH